MQTKVSQADSHNIRYPLYQFICFSPSQANLHNCYLKSFLQILPFLFYTAAEYFYFGLGKFDLHTPPSFHTSTNPPPPTLSLTHTHTQISHLSQLTSLGQGPVTAFYFPFLCLCRERQLTVTGLLTITDQDQKLTDLSEILARHGGRGLLPDTTFEIQIIPSLLEELTN